MRLAGRNAQENCGANLGGGIQKWYVFGSRHFLSSFLRVFLSHVQDELLEELEKLEQEELARELLHVGDKEEEPPIKLPSVPSTHLPEEPGTQGYSLVSRT